MRRINQCTFHLSRRGQLFFHPVQLDFELADLLIKLGLECFIRLLFDGGRVGEKVAGFLLDQGLGVDVRTNGKQTPLITASLLPASAHKEGLHQGGHSRHPSVLTRIELQLPVSGSRGPGVTGVGRGVVG